MTWHMVEQYGQPSPVECMRERLAEAAVRLGALMDDFELSDTQKTDLAIGCLSHVIAMSYLLRSGWSSAAYQTFRNPLLELLNDFDRVRAARVIETTLGERAPEDWVVDRVLPQASAWLSAALPEMLSRLKTPADEAVNAELSTLARHCLETESWLKTHGTRLSGARLAKLLRQGRRLSAVLELFASGLSEEWQTLRPSLVAWVDCLERWSQGRRVARTVQRSGSQKSQARLRRSEHRLSAQTLAAASALQSSPRAPLVIDRFALVTGRCEWIEN